MADADDVRWQVSRVSVRIEQVGPDNTVFYANDSDMKSLRNHPENGSLLSEIKADAKERDGKKFDVVADPDGTYRMNKVEAVTGGNHA